jgi:hypothetical protein
VIGGSFEAYNLDAATYHVRDVWAGKNTAKVKSVQDLALEPHASVLWLLKK